MHIIIVGCGIGGLACAIGTRKNGHRVTVLERATQIQPFGAGINITPNATRGLQALGVLDQILRHAYLPEYAVLRSYDTSAILSRQRLGSLLIDMYNTPYAVIHRYDLYSVLYEEACKLGVRVVFSQEVVLLDPSIPSATTSNGTVFVGDLIIGADGERSVCRDVVLGRPVPSLDSGDHVFRITIPRSRVATIPHLTHLVDPPCINLLLGPGGVAMTYSIKRDDLLNVVLSMVHEEIEDPPVLPYYVQLSEVRDAFRGWGLVQDLLDLADKCIRWTLVDTAMSGKWVKGKTVLIGDAAHATLPFIGQGAAMAIEDAVVLSSILANVSNDPQDTLENALDRYYQVRYQRTSLIKSKGRTLRDVFACPDGPIQEERDQRLRSEMSLLEASEKLGNTSVKLDKSFARDSPNFLADVAFRNFLMSYDAERVGREASC